MSRFALVCALVPAIAAASVVGPAFPLEVPALQPSPGVEQDAAVATDGTDSGYGAGPAAIGAMLEYLAAVTTTDRGDEVRVDHPGTLVALTTPAGVSTPSVGVSGESWARMLFMTSGETTCTGVVPMRASSFCASPRRCTSAR